MTYAGTTPDVIFSEQIIFLDTSHHLRRAARPEQLLELVEADRAAAVRVHGSEHFLQIRVCHHFLRQFAVLAHRAAKLVEVEFAGVVAVVVLE